MKNIFRSILAVAVAAMTVAACNVDNYKAVYEPSDNEVSFLQSTVVSTEINAKATNFDIEVARTNTNGVLQIPVDGSKLPAGVTCAANVTFADGEAKAAISLNVSAMEVGKTYKGTISLIPANTTGGYQENIAITSASLTLAKAFKWVDYGKCNYTDDIVGPLFSAPNVTYPVKVMKAEGLDCYKLIDPYGADFPYNEPGDFRTGVEWVINAIDHNSVTYDKTKLGVDWGYGEMYTEILAPGKLENNKITFPTKGVVVYDNDGGYYANTNGAFCLDLNILK